MPFAVDVERFTLVEVNQTEVRVAPGGSRPLCQAIPVTEIRARLRWRGGSTRGAGARVVVRFTVPGHRARSRTIRLAARRGRRDVAFTPRTEHLRDEAFPGGRYVLEVRRGTRTIERATLRLTHDVRAC